MQCEHHIIRFMCVIYKTDNGIALNLCDQMFYDFCELATTYRKHESTKLLRNGDASHEISEEHQNLGAMKL